MALGCCEPIEVREQQAGRQQVKGDSGFDAAGLLWRKHGEQVTQEEKLASPGKWQTAD